MMKKIASPRMDGNHTKSAGKWMMIAGLMISVIIFASWSWRAQQQIEMLEQEIATKEMRFSMMQLQSELHAPSEMLYFDYIALGKEMAALRMKGYATYGVTTYLPYMNVVSANGEMSQNHSREFPAVRHTDNFLGELQNTSPENYWLNNLASSCGNIAYKINRNEELGAYLKQHPEQFDKHIRPLIVRLLDAYHPYVGFCACDVLLAMGDRSDELMEIVAIFSRLEKSIFDPEDLVERYQLDVKSYEKVMLHDDVTMTLNPEWKRVHELTMKLKSNYPVVSGTNIGHWRQ